MKNPVSRAEPLQLKDVWSKEDADFTPWLSSDSGMEWLCQDLGLESLKALGTEVYTGASKRIDILAELPNGDPVVIENQYYAADDSHGWRTMHYALWAGAKTAIWIFESVPVHQERLIEFINNNTEGLDIIGVCAKVHDVGASLPTLQFEVIPASQEALDRLRGAGDVETEVKPPSDLQNFYGEYFPDLLTSTNSILRNGKHNKGHGGYGWQSFCEWSSKQGGWMKWHAAFNQQRGRRGEYRITILFNSASKDANLSRLNYLQQNSEFLFKGIELEFEEDWNSTVGKQGQKVHFKYPEEVNCKDMSSGTRSSLISWTQHILQSLVKNTNKLDIKSFPSESVDNTYSMNGRSNHISVAP
jgi:hypothetical protein